MKKPARKSPKKKAAKKPSKGTVANQAAAGKEPRSKQQAAIAAGVFLRTDDSWSLAYFDPSDLHNLERELFGKAS